MPWVQGCWYPNDTLQHGGVILVRGVAGHAHKGLEAGSGGYCSRAALIQNFSGVTGACLAIRREIFEELGGFDETIPVAFNDVDFCLRVVAAGYRNVWTRTRSYTITNPHLAGMRTRRKGRPGSGRK